MDCDLEFEAELKKRGAPFKYGLVQPYLKKLLFEDEISLLVLHITLPMRMRDCIQIRLRKALIRKKFLKQVREVINSDFTYT